MSGRPEQSAAPGASQLVLIHYAEVGLKGRNRAHFEERLRRNIDGALRDLPRPTRVRRLFGRMMAEVPAEVPFEAIRERLARCFGVAWFAPTWSTPPDFAALQEVVLERLRAWREAGRDIGRFAVRARRANRLFPMNSEQIGRELGAAIHLGTGAPVDLTKPDTTVFVQVLHERIMVSFERHQGPGGLPVGVSGRALALLSGGIDSPVAAWCMMKRGLHLDFVHFHSAPYTSKASVDKALELARMMTAWQLHSRVFVVPFAETQRVIVTDAPPELRVLLYRRFMLRIAERLAREHRLAGLITGEAVGQVASQTLANIGSIEAACGLPVLRPLIGSDKWEIVERARRIGTFETSTEPHDDCCSYLMPRAPATRSSPGQLDRAESKLDVEALIAEPLSRLEVHEIHAPGNEPRERDAGAPSPGAGELRHG